MAERREPLTAVESQKIVLNLLGIKAKRNQNNRKRGKYLIMVNEQAERRCVLCPETRCLERAHILPVSLYEHIHIDGKLAPIYHHALWMCPTHHKCYDKFKLNNAEKAHMQWILSHDYKLAFEYLLTDMEILKKPFSGN